MSNPSIEERMERIVRRVDGLEQRVERFIVTGSTEPPPVSFWSRLFTKKSRQKPKTETQSFLALSGWFVIGVTTAALFIQNSQTTYISPILILLLLLGMWLVVRQSDIIGISDSSLKLLQEERAGKRVFAHQAHFPYVSWSKKKSELPALTARLSIALILVIALAIGYSWLSFSYITDPVWQSLAFLLFLLVALAFALPMPSQELTYLALAAIYVVLAASQAPLFAVVALAIVSIGMGIFAWLRKDWVLFLGIVMATYTSLIRWTYAMSYGTYNQTLLVEGVMAELLLVLVIFFSLPFLTRRRQAIGREIMRGAIITNALGFTFLSSWLTYRIVPDSWLVPYELALLTFFVCSGIAWTQHGRYSYGKYFAMAGLAALLIGSMIYFNTALITLIWFMAAVTVLTVGFVFESYTARFLGLCTLAGAFLHYLFVFLPDTQLAVGTIWSQSRLWVGLLLTAYLIIAAFWFKSSRLRGPEQSYKPQILAALGTAAVVTLSAVLWLVIQYYFFN